MTNNEAIELGIAIREYNIREFDELVIPEIPEDGIIGMAYTTFEDEESDNYGHEIQVDIDVNNLKWLYYVDGELVGYDNEWSLSALTQDIKYCDWDGLIDDCVSHYRDYLDEKKGA